MIDIRRQDKVVLIPDELQQIVIHRLRGFLIAVDQDMSAPPRPEFFRTELHNLKAAGVHIPDAVLLGEIGKVLVEPFARIGQSCRGG